MTVSSTEQPGSPSPLKARRIRFSYPDGAQRQHFADGQLVASHMFAVLSGLFPEGEDFFIRSVRAHRGEITDPAMMQAVKGFIAQEATHRQQHKILNERLQEMGYPTARLDRHLKHLFGLWEKVLPEKMCLAATAAAEHYTGMLAEIVLNSDEMQDMLGDSDIRSLLLWHAFEECEHKAVAFDVFRAIGGTERMRKAGMVLIQATFLPEVIIQTARSLAFDRAAYNPVRLVRSVRALRRSPLFDRAAMYRYGSYYRNDFHPDDWDTTDLLAEWSKKLFDADGAQRA
ncbi:metal-dependent hydrolase [Mycolicibacterium sediminis]|uniref:Metal-dependent hydrolase n=1 Tax=Mycolicibacterium sediminis TaxID=1286180 RepID=A0A7I7QL64_9MYCO|nr:metal-dependent hydrolase [Mycolicibacterium sediminis]BBY27088.1 hypothetical protein MSEDJ_11840 [Mycolicibacterium sediminis]